MIKKIVSVFSIVLAIGLCVFLWVHNQNVQEQNAKYEKLNDKLRPLNLEKQEIERQIKQLEEDYNLERKLRATAEVVFTGLEEEVYSICYPIMKEYKCNGILAIAWNQLPGMEGCMSESQFQELIKEGWEICIKWDTDTDVKTWWPKLQQELKRFGLETGKVAYFTTGKYSKSMDAKLQELGFGIAIHHGEETDTLIQANHEEGIWHLGAVGLVGEKPKLRLTEAISQRANITYLVGFELEDEQYDERSFRAMLSYFDKYRANEELVVLSMEDTREHYRRRQLLNDNTEDPEYVKARTELEEQLSKVNKQIEELKAQEG